MTNKIKIEKNLVEQKLKKTENLGTKELAATARQRLPPQKKHKNPPRRLRALTPPFIPDNATSIAT